MLSRWWVFPSILFAGTLLAAALIFVFAAIIIYPALPSLDLLTDYQPKVPLRVYSAEGQLIGEFGEERRAVVKRRDQSGRELTVSIDSSESIREDDVLYVKESLF